MGTSKGKDSEDAQPSRDRLRNAHRANILSLYPALGHDAESPYRHAPRRDAFSGYPSEAFLPLAISRKFPFPGYVGDRVLGSSECRLNLFLRVRIITNSVIKSTLGLLVVLEIFHLLQTLFGCGFRFVGAT
jgi:hypothetical protein